ncbi:MAG: SGNH/GDSL hydrolase family protein [Clostridia bacterium]|nr:SGNH/GDSL hydrolase family protein [Clostridia bacterium]
MKSRKFLMLLTGSLAVLMAIVVIVTFAVFGVRTEEHSKKIRKKEYYQKEGFVPGENTTTVIDVDETENLHSGTGAMKPDDTLKDNSGSGNGTTVAKPYVLDELNLPSKYTTRVGKITQKMAEVSVLNGGNKVRLNEKIKAFMKGGDFTIGYIGGSITQGAVASSEQARYANLTTAWLEGTFPRSTFKTQNAGIGSTGSYIGIHRAQNDLLAAKPDIVFIEYAVNDSAGDNTAYDNLIRKIWNSPSKPAVILLTNVARDMGTKEYRSNKESELENGKFYDLPVLSPGDAILYTCNNEKMAQWNELINASDWVHPTDYGHSVISQVIQRYLRGVIEDNVAGKISGKESDLTKSLYTEKYKNATILQPANTKPVKNSGFTTSKEKLQQFNGYWKASKTNSSIEFDVTGKNIGLLYLMTDSSSETHKSGIFEVYIDGKLVRAINTSYTMEYPKGEEFFTSSTSAKHHVKIVALDGEVYLQALLVS